MSEPLTAEEIEQVRRRSEAWRTAPEGFDGRTEHPETQCYADIDRARLLVTLDAARATGLRRCEHALATPCVDRNGSCGTHLSPWPAREPGLGFIDSDPNRPKDRVPYDPIDHADRDGTERPG